MLSASFYYSLLHQLYTKLNTVTALNAARNISCSVLLNGGIIENYVSLSRVRLCTILLGLKGVA